VNLLSLVNVVLMPPDNNDNSDEDTEDLVAKTMSEATFTSILRNITFVKTKVADPKDRFWKVRPLFDLINDCAKHPKDVSIDEGMVKYFGPHPLKQLMRGKPHRFWLQDFDYDIQLWRSACLPTLWRCQHIHPRLWPGGGP
jgi:hypothetical protein